MEFPMINGDRTIRYEESLIRVDYESSFIRLIFNQNLIPPYLVGAMIKGSYKTYLSYGWEKGNNTIVANVSKNYYHMFLLTYEYERDYHTVREVFQGLGT